MNLVDAGGNIPIAAAIIIVGSLLEGVSEGLQAYSSSGGNLSKTGVASLQGAAAGAVSSAVGIGVATFATKNPYAIGASANVAGELTLQILRGQMSIADALTAAASGAALGGAVEKIPGLRLVGKSPDLFTSRTLARYGKNTRRVLGQGILGGILAEIIGAVDPCP